jgi:hypothetical protein
MTVHWGSTLLKMLMSDPRHHPGIGDSLIKLFSVGNSSGILGFPEIFRSLIREKPSLGSYGLEKNLYPRSGINIVDHISQSLGTSVADPESGAFLAPEPGYGIPDPKPIFLRA